MLLKNIYNIIFTNKKIIFKILETLLQRDLYIKKGINLLSFKAYSMTQFHEPVL